MFEPFKIPSGSMSPTLRAGDFILVDKYAYGGMRLPVLDTRIGGAAPPRRGDVIVFRYPPHPTADVIKRVVGLPGDEVAYLDKRLSINGEAMPTYDAGPVADGRSARYVRQFEEQLDGHRHLVLNDDGRPALVQGASDFAFKENCRYPAEGIVCRVPAGQYFTMGDNRDNSLDSRFWGFVPQDDIIGKATFVWMNLDDPGHIGGIR